MVQHRPFRRILVPLDDSNCAQRALFHALSFAHAFRAEVKLLHVVEHPGVTAQFLESNMQAAFAEVEQAAERYLAALSDEEHDREITVEGRVCRAPTAASGILQEVDVREDLIVMGARGRRETDPFEMGPTASKIVRRASCPVLTVGATGGRAPEFVQRILVPLDFSTSACRTLRLAESIAHGLDAELLVLHVIEPFVRPLFFRKRPHIFTSRAPISCEQARERLHELIQDEGVSVSCRVLAECARPADGILALAQRYDAHMIVQGAQGRTEWDDDAVLGSVASEVVRRAHCPVITVKHAAAELSAKGEKTAVTATLPDSSDN